MSSENQARYVNAAADLIGLSIPGPCRAGVDANLTLFLRHAAIVALADDDPLREPAEVLHP